MARRKKYSREIKQILWLSIAMSLSVIIYQLPALYRQMAYNRYSTGCVGRNKTFDGFDCRIPKGWQVYGLDVSHYVCSVDWLDVKETNFGGINMSFAFMRATIGTAELDQEFERSWQKAKRAGILRGAYHYFKPEKNALSQADFFLRHAMPEAGDLPPVFDLEETNGISDEEVIKQSRLWLRHVEKAAGVKPIIYVNQDYYKRFIKGNFEGYPIWLAAYNTTEQQLPEELEWAFWQFTNKAHVNGVSEWVDLNVFRGTPEDLKALCKKPQPRAQ